MARLLAWRLVWFTLARLEGKLESFRSGTAAMQMPDLAVLRDQLFALWR